MKPNHLWKSLKKWIPKKESDKKASLNGEKLLSGNLKILVKYNRKKYDLLELLELLIKDTEAYEEHYCIPEAGCIFKVREILGEKAIEKYYQDD